MTVSKSMQLSAFWCCVKAIAEDISCMPLDLFEIDIKGNKQFATKNKMFNMMKNTCNSDGMLAMTMIETIIVNCLLWGNGYIQKVFNKQGEIIELFPLFSSRMEISRNDSGDIIYIYTKDNGTKRIFKKIQIINIPLFSLDGIKGLSVVKYSNNSLLLTDEAEKFGRNFFKSGSRPSGILEMEIGTKLKDKPATINEWTKSYSGSDNVGKIAILEGGMKYKSIGIPPEDAQFLETRQFQILEICRWFRIPPHKIGDLSRATFSNIEQQNIDYLSVLKPLMRKIEKTLSVSLLEDYSLFFKFDSDSLLRGDFESRMRGYAIASQNGIMSSNEIRGKENINANQNGDELMVNGNMIPLAIAKKGGAGIETKK